jgi:hypothetical protein
MLIAAVRHRVLRQAMDAADCASCCDEGGTRLAELGRTYFTVVLVILSLAKGACYVYDAPIEARLRLNNQGQGACVVASPKAFSIRGIVQLERAPFGDKALDC